MLSPLSQKATKYPMGFCTVVLMIALFGTSVYGQQQFHNRYQFKAKKFNTSRTKTPAGLYKIPQTPKGQDVIVGYANIAGKVTPIHKAPYLPIVVPANSMLINDIPTLKGHYLYGLIDRRTDDTLFIHFWYINPAKDPVQLKGSKTYINSAYNDTTFAYYIGDDNWRKFDVPFNFWMLTATAIPYAIDLKTGKTNANILDVNLACFYVTGRTRFYKNTDIDPRNIYFGIGPFIGLKPVADDTDASKAFSFTYGASGLFSIHGVNIVASFGLEKLHTNPYVGLGIGFSLVNLFDPTSAF